MFKSVPKVNRFKRLLLVAAHTFENNAKILLLILSLTKITTAVKNCSIFF